MPPTIPESDFEAMEDDYETSNIKKYVYDIKFDVVMKDGTKTIPGKASLLKALTTIKNAKRKTEKIDFFDTNGQQISHDLRGIGDEEIEGRFCMEVGGFNDNNLFFACKIGTNISFSILKGRTIDEFKKHNIYFKIHKGGFNHGVNWSTIGFFVKQHPGFIDTKIVKENMMSKISNSWYQDKAFFDDEQKIKIAKAIDPDAHLESFDPLSIPFAAIQTTISAKNSDNENIRVNAVAVTIPYQFFKVGITIMDHMAISTESIKNYIPIGYKKEEPDNFFNIVHEHSKWMENVRHIAVINVSTNQQFKEETNPKGQTLETILQQTKNIDNLGFIRSKKLVQVAILGHKFQAATDCIQEALENADLSYNPKVAKKFNPNGSLGSFKSGTSKYSSAMAKYQTNRSPNGSIATSQGEDISRITGYTGRSWGAPRKIPKEIDFTDATQFPPLQSMTNKPDNDSTNLAHTATLDDSITDTTAIQQAIDSALKKAYEAHRKELMDLQEKFNQQLELIQRQQHNTNLETKVDRLMEILLMDKERERESPIRKKGKPNNLEHTAFASTTTPTRSNRFHKEPIYDDTSMQDQSSDDEPPMGPHFTTASSGNDNHSTKSEDNSSQSSEASETEWITKTKKEKKFPKMTQTKIIDMMQNGGYGKNNNSPPRKNTNSYNSARNTPPRAGRGTPPRPNPNDKQQQNKQEVQLTKLTSSRGGQKEPHGRES